MKLILATLISIGLVLLLGFAGARDQGTITLAQYITYSAIDLGVMGICTYLLNRYD